ncbi:GreA/GreB family elongation factor [Pseudoalteromonas sp. H105]|uniref:GreA/GreB family elongation factor n=1 Tax=Pseudoalteromonas sp. H105 TaxID=1348393 RepID=UPI0007323D3B|nr:GreA/GreB family elongation factor [Pseudoalteromonas sp. H105]KTF18307.1 transcription elongation factor GreAB [Pseudoalteromonas sp. H105]
MNKSHIIEHLRFALQAQLTTAQAAAKTAHDAATHVENIAENKYDTLGLEAGYLAHGQAQRVNDCHLSLVEFEKVFKEPIKDKVSLGSLVGVSDEDEQRKWYYLGPMSGGLSVTVKSELVYVLTPQSPLGNELMNKQRDDEISFTIAGKSQQLIIEAIL